MKIPKKTHRKQTSLCKTLTKLLATGLACAAVLIGSPATPAHGNISNGNAFHGNIFHKNTDSAGSWTESGNCGESGTNNGQEITPQDNWGTQLEQEK